MYKLVLNPVGSYPPAMVGYDEEAQEPTIVTIEPRGGPVLHPVTAGILRGLMFVQVVFVAGVSEPPPEILLGTIASSVTLVAVEVGPRLGCDPTLIARGFIIFCLCVMPYAFQVMSIYLLVYIPLYILLYVSYLVL